MDIRRIMRNIPSFILSNQNESLMEEVILDEVEAINNDMLRSAING